MSVYANPRFPGKPAKDAVPTGERRRCAAHRVTRHGTAGLDFWGIPCVLSSEGGIVLASTTSDEDLVFALRAGDHDSLATLVTRWERPLFGFAYRLLAHEEDARDVCQETFLRVLDRSSGFRDGHRFSTWMYQIALNLCRDRKRRARRWRLRVIDGGLDDPQASEPAAPEDASPVRELEREEVRRLVADALDHLPPEQREVLVLKEFEGLRFRDIAEITGAPESTVKSRMYYGLRALREHLEARGTDGVRHVV